MMEKPSRERDVKRRSGTVQAAQHRKGGPHGKPPKAYQRHDKHGRGKHAFRDYLTN